MVKSRSRSVWPVFLMINELPYSIRRQRQNMIVAGIWCSEIRPVMNIFLDPIKRCLVMVETQGIDINVNGENRNVKGYLICASADIPAKAMLLEMKQHNGEYCCNKCYQSGTNFRTNTNGNIRVLPYCEENPNGPNVVMQILWETLEMRYVVERLRVHGIKGPCMLLGLTLWKVSPLTTCTVCYRVLWNLSGDSGFLPNMLRNCFHCTHLCHWWTNDWKTFVQSVQ